jgi:hypothetical protein
MASEGAETASQSQNEGGRAAPRGAALKAFAAAAGNHVAGFLRRHARTLATAVAVLGGLSLLYAETLDLYRIVTPAGSISNAAGSVRTGSDQHSWAFGVIGVAGAAAAVLARITGQRLPALATATLGAIALVTALVADLPDVTASGVTTDLEVGDAEPAAGFWFEVAGAIVMAAGGAALAALAAVGQQAGPRDGPGTAR